jgi:diaminopimelate epimerase
VEKLSFTKMHGTGNDFVFLDGIRAPLPDVANLAARLCDRRFGIGCDQLLVLRRSPISAGSSTRRL